MEAAQPELQGNSALLGSAGPHGEMQAPQWGGGMWRGFAAGGFVSSG